MLMVVFVIVVLAALVAFLVHRNSSQEPVAPVVPDIAPLNEAKPRNRRSGDPEL